MDTQNLDAASDHINNLLLARGLLRNGDRIDFAGTARDRDGDGATMGRIMNLVHDLVTRRDRDTEQRENLANTVRTLRNTESQQGAEIERLETKANDLNRSLALAEGQERTSKTTIRNAEAASKSLREQMQRMKTSIQQVRAQCANDLRKRDVEIQKLKSHLAERQRGKREGLGVTTITVTPPRKDSVPGKAAEAGEDVNAPGYSLKQETTEFLTRLCQNLSDENDTLIAIARNSIRTLRSLQGLPVTSDHDAGSEGFQPKTEPSSPGSCQSDPLLPPTQCEAISSDMDIVLGQLKTLLTNPSFVPLEEVELRDKEISRLREGWEEMEIRWRKAVSMMDGLHKHISSDGGSVNRHVLQCKLQGQC